MFCQILHDHADVFVKALFPNTRKSMQIGNTLWAF